MLNLKDVTEVDDPVEITVSRSTGGVIKKVQSFASAYNTLLNGLKAKTEYNATEKKMGILSRDVTATFMKSQMRNPFSGIIDGFVDTIDDFVQASDIGITFNGSGEMEVDVEVFGDAINENYFDVFELLGATKSGNSTNADAIDFYAASDKYTTAGTYEVEVDLIDIEDATRIDEVRIRLTGETEWRTEGITWDGNGIVTVKNTDEPYNPEHLLQLEVNLNKPPDVTYDATVYVKQGMAGALEDLLATALDTDGQLDKSKLIIEEKIESMTKRIDAEERRLNNVETRLITKYARLERTLAMLQQQQGAVSVMPM